MAKITSVEPQKKNLHRFNIFLDGQFAFGADEDLVVDRRLVVSKEISDEDLEQILFEAEVGKLMERMYRLFNIRQRSEKEVRNYLRNLSFKRKVKGKEEISDMVIDSLIDKLKSKRMINDEEFAKAWMESRTRKYGLNRVKQELFSKGLGREVIEQVMDQPRGQDQEQLAKKLLQKKIERWKNLPNLEFRKKAYEYLLRRGFEYSVVKDIVENFLKND